MTKVHYQDVSLADAVARGSPVVATILAIGTLACRDAGRKIAYTLRTTDIEIVRALAPDPTFPAGARIRCVDPAQEQSAIAGAEYHMLGLSKRWFEAYYKTTATQEDYVVGSTLIFFLSHQCVLDDRIVAPNNSRQDCVRYLACGCGYERLAREPEIVKAARGNADRPTNLQA